nr:hypothetical protein CFP56_31831 [Quercus suber]
MVLRCALDHIRRLGSRRWCRQHARAHTHSPASVAIRSCTYGPVQKSSRHLPVWLPNLVSFHRNQLKSPGKSLLFGSSNVLLFIAFLVSYTRYLTSPHPFVDVVGPLAWQQALICCALISATMPVFKGFVSRFTTQDLVRIDHTELRPRSHNPGPSAQGTVRRSSQVILSLHPSGTGGRARTNEAQIDIATRGQ